MQLIALASAAALVATASASTSFNLNSTCDESKPLARIHNRCPYPVHVWSVVKGQGCPSDDGATLETGQVYQENYRPAVNGVGTSIKVSKTSKCKDDIAQLEYYIETGQPGYNYNYLDVSYVDCAGGKCPTREEGFYLKSGNTADGKFKANTLNEICPILSCNDKESCAKVAYIRPDDRQTKSCSPEANLDWYMCGGEAPGEASAGPAPQPSSKKEAKPTAPSVAAPSYVKAADAAVTSAPAKVEEQKPNIKTEIVYVTQYAEAKRHAHSHRHQHFRA
ncbi:hypothetical protein K469DRAFT_591765 [Zopfia rhizophila CBS 207.26]|uniref:Osmotin, thaumatin-like protein n=1 Tax=Zopfia rhizophila CBS 207.26 TaxID=1314779 RepID=A0A6A6DS74_9PEZI|nr:hypothetical protein K469DRAFT_591765 [Zopfia rhizophila CBS 207.26]